MTDNQSNYKSKKMGSNTIPVKCITSEAGDRGRDIQMSHQAGLIKCLTFNDFKIRRKRQAGAASILKCTAECIHSNPGNGVRKFD